MPVVPPDAALAEHARFARRLAGALLRDDADADDAAQDALVATVTRGPVDDGARRSWLARVVRNAAARLRRGEGRRARRETVAAARGPRAVPSAADLAERAEVYAALAAALARLPEASRTAVMLRHDAGLPPREIAARLGVPVETVKSRLRRGLDELRALLAADPRTRGDTRRAYALVLAGAAGDAAPTPSAPTPAAPTAGPAVAWALAALAAAGVGVAILGRDAAPAAPDAATVAAVADGTAAAPPPAVRPAPGPSLAGAASGSPVIARGGAPAGTDGAASPASTTPAGPRVGDGAGDRPLREAAVPVAYPAVEVAAFRSGTPAARAALRLECFEAATDAALTERRLPLDGDGVGRFASLPDGTYRLWLDGPGEARRWWPFVHAGRDDADTRQRLVFAIGTASIAGRVFGRDGRPAIDVEVGIRIERDGVTDTLVETRSGADGRYLLDHLPPGRGVLFAQVGGAGNGADEHLRDLAVADGAALTVDLGSEVADPLWTGGLCWASGTPVRGPGWLHAGVDSARGGQIVVPFGADGRFAHRVAEGPHGFDVRRPATPAADGEPPHAPLSGPRVDVTVTADGGPARVVLPGVCVRGTVVAGAADVRVEGTLVLAHEPLAGPAADPRVAPPCAAVVGADGRFVLEGVPQGRWSLRRADDATEVVGDDGRPVGFDVAADRDVDALRLVVRAARPR